MARAGSPAWDEDEAFVDERPIRRVRRKRRSWLRMTLISCLMIAGLVYFAEQDRDEARVAAGTDVPSSVLIAPAPLWSAVAATPALYTLEKAPGPLAVEARQHTSGTREDTVTMGQFGESRHARLIFVQGSSEPARSFFVDIVRRAAQAGLAVSRNAQSRVIATKFGAVEAASMTLVGSGEQECQAFRFSDGDAGFGFQGWICEAGAGPLDDAWLACFIDGIGLSGSGSPFLRALFARAERNRTEACDIAARTASTRVSPPPRP